MIPLGAGPILLLAVLAILVAADVFLLAIGKRK